MLSLWKPCSSAHSWTELFSGPCWVQLSGEFLHSLARPIAPTTVTCVPAGTGGVGVLATQGGTGPKGALIAEGAAYLQWG